MLRIDGGVTWGYYGKIKAPMSRVLVWTVVYGLNTVWSREHCCMTKHGPIQCDSTLRKSFITQQATYRSFRSSKKINKWAFMAYCKDKMTVEIWQAWSAIKCWVKKASWPCIHCIWHAQYSWNVQAVWAALEGFCEVWAELWMSLIFFLKVRLV